MPIIELANKVFENKWFNFLCISTPLIKSDFSRVVQYMDQCCSVIIKVIVIEFLAKVFQQLCKLRKSTNDWKIFKCNQNEYFPIICTFFQQLCKLRKSTNDWKIFILVAFDVWALFRSLLRGPETNYLFCLAKATCKLVHNID